MNQTFQTLVQAIHLRLKKHMPVTFSVQFEVVQGNKTFYLKDLLVDGKNYVYAVLVEHPNFCLRMEHKSGADERKIVDRLNFSDQLKVQQLLRYAHEHPSILGLPNNDLVRLIIEIQELFKIGRE